MTQRAAHEGQDTGTTDTGTDDVVLGVVPLGFPWPTLDPFLACIHHDDAYPAGDENLAPPTTSLKGRQPGQDFDPKNAWRMYHGSVVPGFPQHPHRGFETVTVVRKGLLDHSDSLGASARYGNGDVQWLTTGKGILHAEMFPLLRSDAPNPLDLFQLWLNLPAEDKMVDPHFKMLWSEDIPVVREEGVAVTVIAGAFGATQPPPPAPKSWAARADADVAIWTLEMAPAARIVLPKAQSGSLRILYFHQGQTLTVAGQTVAVRHAIQVRGDVDVVVENGPAAASLLLLQGRPIGEPVAQHGPFVMNSAHEIEQAFRDYQRTRFGGWPWPRDDQVHPADAGRFAKHSNGQVEKRRG